MISVLISAGSRYPFDRKTIRKKAKDFLRQAGLREVEVSLSIVGTRKSLFLNKQYRQLDQPASVLAFGLDDPRGPDGVLRLGDVVVCYPIARQQAVQQRKMMDDVLWELVEHGIKNLIKMT